MRYNTAKRTYYHTCEYCGANLDPNELCDCMKEKNTRQSIINLNYKTNPANIVNSNHEIIKKNLKM